MNHAVTCKFCQKPITLTIDDSYSELGDPLKILNLAACNTCADLRVRHRKESDAIAKACFSLIELRLRKKTEPAQAIIRDNLITITRKYAESTALINRCPTVVWSSEFPSILFDNPEQFGNTLSRYQLDLKRNPPA